MRALAPEVHLFHALRRTQLPKEMALQFGQLCPRDPTDTKHANAFAITLHRARTRTATPADQDSRRFIPTLAMALPREEVRAGDRSGSRM